jgi:hypothetical protein
MKKTVKKKSRYRHVEGKPLIEVRIKNPRQLFDARDPAPFRDRDLDDNFVEYIVASARDFPRSTSFKLIIHVEEPEGKELGKDVVRDAIRSYFSYKIDLQRSELKTFLKTAQFFLFIGLGVLACCLGIAQTLTVPQPPGAIGILREGIVIFGWVSVWKPIELVLFDWYPILTKIHFYQKLLETEIDIQFASV